MTPAEWMENQGVDTQQIVSYYVKDGVGDGTFIDVEELLAGYAAHVAEYTAPKDLPDHCQDPCSGFAGGCVMEGHCKECEQTKKNPPMKKNEKTPAPITPADWLALQQTESQKKTVEHGLLPVYSADQVESLLEDYAIHVKWIERARAAEIVAECCDTETPAPIAGTRAINKIMTTA